MRSIFMLLLIGSLGMHGLQAQGITFFEGSWEEALAKAKAEQKLIFMDAYAEWCGPCKRMAKMVFTQSEAGAFYNNSFINLKIDMEKGEGLQLRKKFRVTAYPTLLFIDYDGNLVKRSTGAKPLEAFISLGKSALKEVDRSAAFVAQYEAGERSPDFIHKYIQALNASGKSSLSVANNYLRSQTDLSLPENLAIIYTATVSVDSRIFDLMIKYRSALEEMYPPEVIDQKVLSAARNSLNKALEFDSEELLDETIKKVRKNFPDQAESFASQAKMAFAKKGKDELSFVQALRSYVKKGMKQDGTDQSILIANESIKAFPKSDKVVDLVIQIHESVIEKAKAPKYYLGYARVLAFSGQESKAIEQAKIALAKAKGIDQVTQIEATRFLDTLSND